VHELGLCEDVLQAVLRRAGGRTVTAVRVRVGALHRVSDQAFDQAFALVAAGTPAEAAAVDVVTVPVAARCRDCAATCDGDNPVPACPACGSGEIEIVHGNELILESIALGAS
jgi:hydrogenase nickel incorporation protein HypA/HybF